MSAMTAALRAELAPGGRLRVGINYGNFLLVRADAADGAPQGIALTSRASSRAAPACRSSSSATSRPGRWPTR
ncbi:MAG: hypothetical protein U1F45_01720 [Burkholderiales bacterium]